MIFFHPDHWGNDPIWPKCYNWVAEPPTTSSSRVLTNKNWLWDLRWRFCWVADLLCRRESEKSNAVVRIAVGLMATMMAVGVKIGVWSWSNHGWHDNTWWDDSWQGHRPSWLYQQQPGSMRSYERVHRGYNRRRGGKHLHHYNQVLGQGRVCKMHPDVEILTSCPLAPERTWWRWTNLSSHVDEVELINGEIHAADTPNGLHVRFVRACDAQACVKGLTSSWLKSPKIWGTTHAGILNLIFGYFGARFFST